MKRKKFKIHDLVKILEEMKKCKDFAYGGLPQGQGKVLMTSVPKDLNSPMGGISQK